MSDNETAPHFLYTAQQVRDIDSSAIKEMTEQGIENAGFDLMQGAGASVFNELKQVFRQVGNQIHVFCGGGNNAGDGFVVASLALRQELSVKVYALSDVEKLQGDAQQAYQLFKNSGGQLSELPSELKLGVVIDALFGTGLDRDVGGDYLTAINLINESGLPVLAVDIASGLNADTGCAMGVAVKASKTISFIALKQGLYTADGPELSGEVILDDLAVAEDIVKQQVSQAELVQFEVISKTLKPRQKNSHKGSFGHLLLIGGTAGFSGAIRLAGEAALRTGAGLVSIASRPEHAGLINITRPELMCHGVDNRQQLASLAKQASVLAIGPGLGQSAWSVGLFEAAIEFNKPIVIDADGLNILSQTSLQGENHVLTPHPGEAARLLACSTAEIQQDRFAAIKALQQKYKGVVILKGSGSLLYDGQGSVEICQAGNAGMASGGMGDVLTGVIAGLLAQGYALKTAARLAMLIHATAADIAAKEGERGLLASDLFTPIRQLVNPQIVE